MRILAYNTLKEHWSRPGRADSQGPLVAWYAIAKEAEWRSPADIKAQFRNASFIGDRVVFNIGGNKYRLVIYPRYEWRMIYVRFVGTHAEYDAIDVETV